MNLRKNKRVFTLMEVMIVLAIITMISFFLGSNFFTKIDQLRFQKKVDKVYAQILFCQEMAQVHGIDLQLSFIQKDQHLQMQIGTDSQHGLFHEKMPSKETLEDITVYFNYAYKKNFTLLFSSTGIVFPSESVITIKNKHYEKNIDLKKLRLAYLGREPNGNSSHPNDWQEEQSHWAI